MFYEVKIFDKKNVIKRVISSKKLSKDYWSSFFDRPASELIKKGRGRLQKTQKNTNFDNENFTDLAELNP